MPRYAWKFFRWPLLLLAILAIALLSLRFAPHRPWVIWAVLAISVATFPFLTCLFWIGSFRLQQRLDAAQGQLCPGCGHDLRGTPQPGACPECGRSFDTAKLREAWRHLHGQP